MYTLLSAGANPLVPTFGEVAFSILGIIFLVLSLVFIIFSINVLLTWHRKNKLRTIELEFEEGAIEKRKAGQRV